MKTPDLVGSATFFSYDKNVLKDKDNNVKVWMPTNATKFHKFFVRLKYGWCRYKYEWDESKLP